MITDIKDIGKCIEGESGFFNTDCMDGMRKFPDEYFDLAIVDPPYGGGNAEKTGGVRQDTVRGMVRQVQAYNRFGGRFDRYKSRTHTEGGSSGTTLPPKTGSTPSIKQIEWDIAPSKEYFDELFRVSKNQIIWGGNYFELPPTRCFLIWRKTNVPQTVSFAMAEYAWTSFNANAKVFEMSAVGIKGRFHPTQKPVELYEWQLQNFAKDGYKILDTHAGSGTALVSSYRTRHQFVGFEIDKEYYSKAIKRINDEMSQMTIFDFGV